MDSVEIAIQNALKDIESGQVISIRAAATKWGVPKSTLYDRANGRTNRRVAQQPQQRLTPDQERFLTDWILEQSVHGCLPTHARVREMALRILQINGEREPLGRKWTEGFITRNPRVKNIIGQKSDSTFTRRSQPETLQGFFNNSTAIQSYYELLAEDIWNWMSMDLD